jgi:hypothetical protein
MKTNRSTALSGFDAANYGVATILVCTHSDPTNASAQGYAVALLKGTTNNAVKLIRFTGGLINRSDIFSVLNDNWSENTITWNNAPPNGNYLFTQEFATKLSTQSDTVYVLDITNYAQSEYAGDKMLSLLMVDTTNNGTDIRFWSARAGDAASPVLVISTLTKTENENIQPRVFELYQNYPNPFNPSTVIGFELKEKSHIMLQVYDVLGNVVSVLLNEQLGRVYHFFSFNAKDLPCGIYYYTLQAVGQMATKKLVLLK